MTLDNIKTLYNEGDKETGRAQLIELLEAEPENAKAWAYFGAKTIDLEQRKYCYLKSLEFEPDNATIQARLDKLDEYDPVAPPEFELTDEDEDDPIVPPKLAAVKKGVKGVRNDGGMSTFQKLTLAIFSFVAICVMGSLGVVMMYVVSDGKGLPQVKAQPTLVVPTATKVALPTRALPTATLVPTPTIEPTPTEILFAPCSKEELLIYSLETGQYTVPMNDAFTILFEDLTYGQQIVLRQNIISIAKDFKKLDTPNCPESNQLRQAIIDWFDAMEIAAGDPDKLKYGSELSARLINVAMALKAINDLQ